jgi:tRNA (guanine37-N1)-methyltransferase
MIKNQLEEVHITTCIFEKRKGQKKSLVETLKKKLPSQLLAKIPHAMDIIGQVAVIQIPSELESYKSVLGAAILETNKSLKTVLAKASAVNGEKRLRDFEVLAGTTTETVYKEHDCVYGFDLTKVFFSPRLSQERWRIAQKVKDGEHVIDMFAGIGPFSIQIAKTHPNSKIFAIDINPNAIQFLMRNIVKNKVENVIPFQGDARAIIMKYLIGKGDRIILNLPRKAIEFIDVALKALKPDGGIIHYYAFETGPNVLKKTERKFREKVATTKRGLKTILDSRIVRSTAPYEWQVAIDGLIA